jgi:murein DD-endopeptidase MepM/ murein hydrolase activator NlpD
MNYKNTTSAAFCALIFLFSAVELGAEIPRLPPEAKIFIMSDKPHEYRFFSEPVITFKIKKTVVKPKRSVKSAVYVVKKGDTLFSISQQHGISVDDITRINSLKGNSISVGMRLKVKDTRGTGGDIIRTQAGGAAAKMTSAKNRNLNHKPNSAGPAFSWPVGRVKEYRRDGGSGVNPIGIEIKANSGTPVLCSAHGVVDRIGYMRGFGDYVIVKHSNGYSTVYSNVSAINVREGQRLQRGHVIGRVSSDSRIHFQIDNCGRPENPLKHLPKG